MAQTLGEKFSLRISGAVVWSVFLLSHVQLWLGIDLLVEMHLSSYPLSCLPTLGVGSQESPALLASYIATDSNW